MKTNEKNMRCNEILNAKINEEITIKVSSASRYYLDPESMSANHASDDYIDETVAHFRQLLIETEKAIGKKNTIEYAKLLIKNSIEMRTQFAGSVSTNEDATTKWMEKIICVCKEYMAKQETLCI